MDLKRFLQAFGLVAVLLTLIPLIAADFWWIRVFDFPHIQLTLLSLTALAAYFIRFEIKEIRDYIFMGVLLTCFLYQFAKISAFTPLYPFEIGDAEEQVGDSGFSIMTANVLQKNEEMLPLRDEIKRLDADVMVFTETNTRWMNFIKENLPGNYPYRVEVPLDNTYGMLLYSRLELIDPEVRYLVDDSIPSIHAKVKLKSGDEIQLYAIHPTPPMPQHNPSSTDRDAEMMKVAKLSRESEIPVVVIGDFNDVSWSATTGLFQKTGKLLDVRAGRGFYNTFNAKNLLLRWPLDHIFTTSEFRLIDLELGKDIKSDHFPIYASLSLEPERALEQDPEPPTLEELKEANQIIEDQEEKEKKEANN